MSKPILEICCGSLADALAAELGGAGRVELCSALFLGGLTPSAATIQEAASQLKMPFVVIIRPRSGGFHYSADEMKLMERDAEFALAHGAAGIVVGVLLSDGRVDVARCKRLRELAQGKQAVFHRAFDVVPDPARALEEIIDLGFTRILTSGQARSVAQAANVIRRLIEEAKERIEILPGGGLRAEHLQEFLAQTGCQQIHMTAFRPAKDPSTSARPDIRFGADGAPPESEYQEVDPEKVKQIVQELSAFAGKKASVY
jgi:copper homeostasis protein